MNGERQQVHVVGTGKVLDPQRYIHIVDQSALYFVLTIFLIKEITQVLIKF